LTKTTQSTAAGRQRRRGTARRTAGRPHSRGARHATEPQKTDRIERSAERNQARHAAPFLLLNLQFSSSRLRHGAAVRPALPSTYHFIMSANYTQLKP